MAATVIRFEVLGAAKPQGSKRGFVVRRRDGSHGVAMAESCREVKSWRQQVAAQAYAAKRGGPLIAGPVEIEMHFFRVRPRTHYGAGKNATKIKPKSPKYPISAPDVDKLARAVNDALKGVIWRDDSQVVRQVACKHWGSVDRCEIVIREIAAEQESEAA